MYTAGGWDVCVGRKGGRQKCPKAETTWVAPCRSAFLGKVKLEIPTPSPKDTRSLQGLGRCSNYWGGVMGKVGPKFYAGFVWLRFSQWLQPEVLGMKWLPFWSPEPHKGVQAQGKFAEQLAVDEVRRWLLIWDLQQLLKPCPTKALFRICGPHFGGIRGACFWDFWPRQPSRRLVQLAAWGLLFRPFLSLWFELKDFKDSSSCYLFIDAHEVKLLIFF